MASIQPRTSPAKFRQNPHTWVYGSECKISPSCRSMPGPVARHRLRAALEKPCEKNAPGASAGSKGLRLLVATLAKLAEVRKIDPPSLRPSPNGNHHFVRNNGWRFFGRFAFKLGQLAANLCDSSIEFLLRSYELYLLYHSHKCLWTIEKF